MCEGCTAHWRREGGKFKETFKERFGIHLPGGCGAGAGRVVLLCFLEAVEGCRMFGAVIVTH